MFTTLKALHTHAGVFTQVRLKVHYIYPLPFYLSVQIYNMIYVIYMITINPVSFYFLCHSLVTYPPLSHLSAVCSRRPWPLSQVDKWEPCERHRNPIPLYLLGGSTLLLWGRLISFHVQKKRRRGGPDETKTALSSSEQSSLEGFNHFLPQSLCLCTTRLPVCLLPPPLRRMLLWWLHKGSVKKL